MKKLFSILFILMFMTVSVHAAQITLDDVGSLTNPQAMFQAADSNFTELYSKWTALGSAYDTSGELSALFAGKQDASAVLDTYAGINPSTNVQSILSAADYAVLRTLLGIYTTGEVDAAIAAITHDGLTGFIANEHIDWTTNSGSTIDINNLPSLTSLHYSIAGTDAAIAALQADDLVTLSGVSIGSTNLGTFTGTTINDNQTVKAALQALETVIEGAAGGHDAVTLGTGVNGITLTGQELALATILERIVDGSGDVDMSGLTLTLPPITGQIAETDLDVTNSPSDGQILTYDNTSSGFTWAGFPVEIGVAASDETTDLTTGTAKITFRVPYGFTLTEVRASVSTAPVGANIVVDVNENGTGVFSTTLSIDAGEETSTTAATAAVISDTAIADDSEITVDIDQTGSTTAGQGLKIWLIGYRSL